MELIDSMNLSNGTRFHSDHYRKVFSARSNERDERYCFALRTKMGKNGRVEEHPLYGQRFKSTKNFKTYTVDSVNIHFWNGGYYWFVVLTDENGSSAPRHWENINSTDELTLNCIKKTKQDFILSNQCNSFKSKQQQ